MNKLIAIISLITSFFAFGQGQETISIMYYNILNYPNINSSRITYLQTIAQHVLPDVLVVSELTSLTGSNTILNDALNVGSVNYYSAAMYIDSPDDERMLYYNSQKLGLVSQNVISTALRDINEYVLYYKAPGMTAASDTVYLYMYACHLKAGNTTTDASDRAAETAILKNYLNSRTNAENTIVGGDMNIYGSTEVAYTNMTGSTNANLYDPIGPGNYHSNGTFAMYFTQSTRLDPIDGGSTGGMDDRFDMMWFSDDVLTGDNAAKFINGSYRAVGQDGLRLNQSLLSPANTSEPSNVLNALYYMSDHLPIYMEVEVGGTLGLSEDVISASDVRVYPSPADEQVFIEVSDASPSRMILTDSFGREILSEVFVGKNISVNTRDLEAGAYFVCIETDKGSITKRFIVR
jgi:hypothetical protein